MKIRAYPEGDGDNEQVYDGMTPDAAALALVDDLDAEAAGLIVRVVVEPVDDEARALPGWRVEAQPTDGADPMFRIFDVTSELTWTATESVGRAAASTPTRPALTRDAVLAFIAVSGVDGTTERAVIDHFNPDNAEENGGPVVDMIGSLLEDSTGDGTVGFEAEPDGQIGRFFITDKGRAAMALVSKGSL